MLVVRALTVLVAGVLTIFALRRMMAGPDTAKVRVKPQQASRPRKVTRLRRDQRTGVYYPEE